MLRQIIASAFVAASILSLGVAPARAQTYQECLDNAAQVRQDLLKAGASRTQADAVFSALVRQCGNNP